MDTSVVHVIGATVAGGAERFVCDLAAELQRTGVRTGVVALSGRLDAAGQTFRTKLSDAGVALSCGPDGPVRLRSILKYQRSIRTWRPQIVHLHTPNTELVHAITSFSIEPTPRVIRTLHNASLQLSPLLRWAYHRNHASTTIACSQAARDGNTWLSSPIEVIDNGIDFHWEIQNPENQLVARTRLGLSNTSNHFLHVGSMAGNSISTSQKAQDILIRAWLEAEEQQTVGELHLLGDGELRPEFERLASGSTSIHFHGIQSNVSDWLLAADVFVMPSRYEGLPIAGIEAVGTGLPCIFSNINSLQLLNPTTCTWIPVDDVPTLSRQISNHARTLPTVPESGTRASRQAFGIATSMEGYLAAYRKLEVSL